MSVYIIAAIVVLLSALACYAFISHAIERRRIQKQRILMALKTKHRNFEYMMSGFPPNVLPPELMSLGLRELIATCEQLAEVDRDNPKHLNDVANYTAQLSALPKTTSGQRPKFDNPAQMKEIQQHLLELQRFVIQLTTTKKISRAQMDTHIEQIKNLSLQLSVDTYIYHAKEAQTQGKLRLAIHYFNLAKKLFSSENDNHHYEKQITQLDAVVAKLEEKAKEQGLIPTEATSETKAPATATKEWENVKSPSDDSWKKKQIYD